MYIEDVSRNNCDYYAWNRDMSVDAYGVQAGRLCMLLTLCNFAGGRVGPSRQGRYFLASTLAPLSGLLVASNGSGYALSGYIPSYACA